MRAAVSLLAAAIALSSGGAWLLTSLQATASLTIESNSESLTVENSRPGHSVDLMLPAGHVTHVSLDENDSLVFDEPRPLNAGRLRIKGPHRLNVQMRGGTLQLIITPAGGPGQLERGNFEWPPGERVAHDSAVNGGGASNAQATIGAPAATSASAGELLQISFRSTTAQAGDAFIPLVGRVIIGESVSRQHEASAGESSAPFLLRRGSVRIRTPAWIPTDTRIELGEYELDPGDVVDSGDSALEEYCRRHAEDQRARKRCVLRQADGFARPDGNGSLESVVYLEQDYVTLRRATPIRIGASAVDKILHQPLVTLAWQGSLLLFGLAGSVLTLFGIITFYREQSTKE